MGVVSNPMASMTYICKSCGQGIAYPAKQDQDEQPIVDIIQTDDNVTIRISPTIWIYDEKGRPRQIVDASHPPETVFHTCTQVLNPPGVNFNLPATPNPRISY